jgi:undecaprenyl-diphosphatase
MNKRGIIMMIAVLSAVFLVSLYFDSDIIQSVSLIRNPFLDDVFLGVVFVSSEIIIFFVLTSLFLWQEKKRKWIFPLWVSLGISSIVSFLLKIGIQRARPFQQGIVSALPSLIDPNFITWNFSFPSFQAMLVFCAVPILTKEFPKLKYFWILFAGLAAFSRVYFGLHFFSDVFAGAVIGYFIGFFIVDFENKKRKWSKIYEKLFYGEK